MSPLLLSILGILACGGDTEPNPDPFSDVERSQTRVLDGLSCPAEVIRTEGEIPRIYAHDRVDLARVQGFVLAQHRFFMMDLARRLALGTTSELLGADALEVDLESRQFAMTFVARQLAEVLTEEERELFAAYAEGINAYIDAVEAGELPAPSELELAAPLLGYDAPAEMMRPFTTEDIAAVGATLIYELGFETGDVGRANTEAALDTLFDGAELGELRRAGARADLWEHVNPVYPVGSAPGWGGADTSAARVAPDGAWVGASARPVPTAVLSRQESRLARFQRRLGHDWDQGFGSNAWAVSGANTTGGALLAGDGHLGLTVPSLFYQIGLDTEVLGGGGLTQAGLVIPGLPLLAQGTNGKIAWGETQLFGDITDWYREELQLGDDGLPQASLFQGEWRALQRTDEVFEIADVPLLGSEGRTETWAQWTTFDGRWITEIEGSQIAADEADGRAVVNLQGDLVVPGDIDGDGVITALSFDYTGLEPANILRALEGFGTAGDVREFQEATRRLVAFSQNLIVADSGGSILYTGYQAVPCRGYLERGEGGDWAPGSDPSQLLDGTVYGGFSIPLDDGVVVEGDADPYRCVVPFADYPQSVNPSQGYVLTANNDPAQIATDDDLLDDPWYIGGPWLEGYRAHVIDGELGALVERGSVSIEDMEALQGDHRSPLGLQLGPLMLASIEAARAASPDASDPAEARLAAWYAAESDRIDEATERVQAWLDGGAEAASGVETFYHQVGEGELEQAAATAIFNAWFNRFLSGIFDDEGLPDVWEPTGATGQLRALTRLLEGRGADNPLGLASWNEATGESAFFDVLGTEEVETSDEIAAAALSDALDFLASDPDGELRGGYGTEDMDQWLWGLRHLVRFESLLGDFIGGGDYDFLVEQFSITTQRLPLADELPDGDPREGLSWFPRPGDNLGVDAANPGFSFTDPTYGSGPVFRMVIQLDGGRVSGQNIVPGGESALVASEAFDDQAALWLGNQTWPLRFHLEEVLAGALSRESYLPEDLGAACAGR